MPPPTTKNPFTTCEHLSRGIVGSGWPKQFLAFLVPKKCPNIYFFQQKSVQNYFFLQPKKSPKFFFSCLKSVKIFFLLAKKCQKIFFFNQKCLSNLFFKTKKCKILFFYPFSLRSTGPLKIFMNLFQIFSSRSLSMISSTISP